MRVVHQVRKVLGIVLAVACFALALYALFHLVQGGSCSTGGNHVSARQCGPGTGWWAAELPLGIIGGLLFLGLGVVKPGRARARTVTATSYTFSGFEDRDPLARLERLRALRDAGALTDAEYDAAKAKILTEL